MHAYSTLRALQYTTLQSLIGDLYAFDVNRYSQLKKDEGQYAYFNYIERVQRAINSVFYKPLPGHLTSIASRIKSSASPRSADTCIVLNNNSLLGHVTVLRSIGFLLQKYSRKGRIYVISLTKGPDDQVLSWKNSLSQANLQIFDLSKFNMADRFNEVDSLLKPRQYIWWGWPPGQWIGPLLARNAIHRSVSFKYDFPAAEYFHSHHIGYGEKYANNISSNCQIYGFTQHFAVDLIPSFSQEKKEISLQARSNSNKLLASKKVVHLGTLGRSEKIAQKPFLKAVKNILLSDKRVIFHWTGKEKSQPVLDYFNKYSLTKRNIFHGWVQPYDYLKQLDLYLDTFPFGTGETFVLAGLMGIPLVAMDSPFEANFTNLFTNTSEIPSFISSNVTDYCLKVKNLLLGSDQHCPQSISSSFEEIFVPGPLTSSKQNAMFAQQLDL